MMRVRTIVERTAATYRMRGFWGFVKAALICFLNRWRALSLTMPVIRRYQLRKFLRSEKPLKLHLGCGSKPLPGYINIDKYPASGADLVIPAHKLCFPDNSVYEICTSHMIEHLRPRDLELALQEWHRVLKSGGKLRIRCPNFELYVREWLEGGYDVRWGWGIINIFGHDDRGQGLLTRNGFTRERLQRLLLENGFETLRCEVTATRPELDGTIEYRPDGDLYYEGAKVNMPKVPYVDSLLR